MIALMSWLMLPGCPEPGVVVEDKLVSAGCGTCVFHMPGMAGCFWAVEIDGVAHPVGGVTPPDDMAAAHAPGGMCTGPRDAIVSGEIRPDGRFLATRFDLQPAAPPDPNAPAHTHTH